jgi:cytochrome P450
MLMDTKEPLEAFKPLSLQMDNLSDTAIGSSGTPLLGPHQPKLLSPSAILLLIAAAYSTWLLAGLIHNVYFHPLRRYPGPLAARASEWWKVYIEVWKKESMTEVLSRLHEEYGDVVRTAPNELHFASPKAYFDIYAPAVRWDKERVLYHSMGVDSTSFGYLKYPQAKQRKDVLQPLFSRRAVSGIQGLVRQKLDYFCDVLALHHASRQSSNIYLGLRCLTVDTISAFCFGQSLNALTASHFEAPIVISMDYANPEFLPFKHLPSYRNLIWALPPSIAAKLLPDTSGFAQISKLTREQVEAALEDPSSLQKYPHQTIYHRLLDPAAQDGRPIPSKELLLEEAKNLIFAGTDTTGNTLYVGMWHLMRDAQLQTRLRQQIRRIWHNLSDEPTYEELASIPLLAAVIKESLRISSGVSSPLSRVVSAQGGIIDGHSVPGGTIVGMSAVFVHQNASIFPEPKTFNADRWLGSNAKELEKYLVSFSRGPRSCLGINLAHCELYMSFGTLVRKFEMTLDESIAGKLNIDENGNLMWRDTFLPWFYGQQVKAWCKPVED